MKKQIMPLVGLVLVIMLAAGGIGAMATELIYGPAINATVSETSLLDVTLSSDQPSTTSIETTTAPSETTPVTDPSISETASPTTTTAPTHTSPAVSYISAAEARAIAIAKVGGNPAVFAFSLDTHENPPIYEVVLQSGEYIYEIEIHAVTGSILDYEKEEQETEHEYEEVDD